MIELNPAKVIDLLGGTNVVAQACDVSPGAVSQWRINGIPKGHRVILAARIEKATDGLLTREIMFEDFKEIWPELLDTDL
jgi:DNA-binding transcriptional regulator YdaS (Cro superfamily)